MVLLSCRRSYHKTWSTIKLTIPVCVLLACFGILAACTSANAPTDNTALIPVRFAAIGSGSQAFIPTILIKRGIAKKYGLDVTLMNLSESGQQWNALRSGDADVATGSFLDLLRQRQAGLKVKAFRGFLTFGNPVVAPADKPYQKLADLKGAKVGTPRATNIDWIILRAAGQRGEGFDIGKEAQVAEASPQLLGQMLFRDQLDAALQFRNLAVGPISEGKLKEVTNIKKVMAEAGLDTDSFYLLYNVADSWRAKYGDAAVAKLVAAMDEAVDVLTTDDTIWPELAKLSGIDDARTLPRFVKETREEFSVTYDQSKIAPTQVLLDQLVATVGKDVLGVTTVDPDAFDFASVPAAKQLRH